MSGSDIWGVSVDIRRVTGVALVCALGVGAMVLPNVGASAAGDGITWVKRNPPVQAYWNAGAYGNSTYVMVGSGGKVVSSADAVTWVERTSANANSWYDVTFGGPSGSELFVAIAFSGTDRVMTSPDGITWTARSVPASNWVSVTYGGPSGSELFVAVSTVGRIMTSSDGITWTDQAAPQNSNWRSVTWGGGLFVAVSQDGANRVMTSPDGLTWTAETGLDGQWNAVTYGGPSGSELYVAVAWQPSKYIMTSPDGSTWTERTAPVDSYWYAVTYANGIFVAVAYGGDGNRVMTSTDGITWADNAGVKGPGGDGEWVDVFYGTAFVAVGNYPTFPIMTSGAVSATTTSTTTTSTTTTTTTSTTSTTVPSSTSSTTPASSSTTPASSSTTPASSSTTPASSSTTSPSSTVAPSVPSWSSSAMISGLTVGTPFTGNFAASGSPAPTYSISAGALPAGLSLNASTGVISGTPTAAGSYSFTLQATNSTGTQTRVFSGTIAEASTTTVAGGSGSSTTSGGGGAASLISFNVIPEEVQTNSAVKVVASTRGRTVGYKPMTVSVCTAGAKYVVTYRSGVCRVNIYVGRRLAKRIRMLVDDAAASGGSKVGHVTLLFNGNASKVTKVALAQMEALRGQMEMSSLVFVMGHTANNGGVIGSAGSYRLSMRRAKSVSDVVKQIGAPVVVTSWYGNTQPATLLRNSPNRRVEVVWIKG